MELIFINLKKEGEKMTKKHFIALARIFSKYNLETQSRDILIDIITLCKSENPNFDKARFLKACRCDINNN